MTFCTYLRARQCWISFAETKLVFTSSFTHYHNALNVLYKVSFHTMYKCHHYHHPRGDRANYISITLLIYMHITRLLSIIKDEYPDRLAEDALPLIRRSLHAEKSPCSGLTSHEGCLVCDQDWVLQSIPPGNGVGSSLGRILGSTPTRTLGTLSGSLRCRAERLLPTVGISSTASEPFRMAQSVLILTARLRCSWSERKPRGHSESVPTDSWNICVSQN